LGCTKKLETTINTPSSHSTIKVCFDFYYVAFATATYDYYLTAFSIDGVQIGLMERDLDNQFLACGFNSPNLILGGDYMTEKLSKCFTVAHSASSATLSF